MEFIGVIGIGLVIAGFTALGTAITTAHEGGVEGNIGTLIGIAVICLLIGTLLCLIVYK